MDTNRWWVSHHLVGVKIGKKLAWHPEPHTIQLDKKKLRVNILASLNGDESTRFLVISDTGEKFVIYLNWQEGRPPLWGVCVAAGKHIKGFEKKFLSHS